MAWWPDSGQQWRRGAAQLALLALLGLVLAGCITRGPRAGASLQDCAQCPALVVVPAGEFRMGAAGGEEGRPEGPVHTVHIARAFALGRHEVTQAQFAAFVSATGHAMGGGCQVWAGQWRTPPDADWTDPGYGRMPFDDEPVTCVSWNDAEAYVQWLARRTGRHYRLPSEAEWEYAARAGSTQPWYGPVDQIAWYAVNGSEQTHPVAKKTPNHWGLYDMLGNVWEWVGDWYDPEYYATMTRQAPVGPPGGTERILRGGAWVNYPRNTRASSRFKYAPKYRVFYIGFRCSGEFR